MSKKNYDKQIESKAILGKLISDSRNKKNFSLRSFSKLINIPASNLVYLEKGVNVPSPEVYDRIINVLKPDDKLHKKMDQLYSAIRKLPPPDVCNVILNNAGVEDVIRACDGKKLSSSQMAQITQYILSLNN